MRRYEVSTINFMLWEGANRFVGAASVVLPNINQKIETITGAGLLGSVDVPVMAQIDPMDVTINFNGYADEAANLRAPGRHSITLRPAVQREDAVAGELLAVGEKHVMVIVPKTLSGPTIAPATHRESALVASVRYWLYEVDNKQIHEIDVMNHIFRINGVDYGAAIRRALGI